MHFSIVQPGRVLSGFTLLLFMILVSVGSAAAQTDSMSNNSPITISTAIGAGSPYPSTINIPFTSRIAKVTVTINGLSHTYPEDVGILLVAPTGDKIRLMSDSGGGTGISNRTITFDDAAASALPNNATIATGTYKPSQGSNETGAGSPHPANFPSPAPSGPYSVLLSDLIGKSALGTWSLYVDDDYAGDGGSIANGWTLNITHGYTFGNTTSIPVPGSGTVGAGSPYPSPIVVADDLYITKVKVRINNMSHTFMDDVGMLLVGPNGQAVRLTTDNGGSNDAVNADYVFDDEAANFITNNGAVPAGTYRPSPDGADDGGSTPHPANFPFPAPTNPYSGSLSVFNGTSAAGTWRLFVNDDTNSDSGVLAGGWSLIIEGFSPTAAAVSVSGRVVTANGAGLPKTRVIISGGSIEQPIETITSPFGYYSFENIPSGETYVISVLGKRHIFPNSPRVVSLMDEMTGLDFIAETP